MKFHLLVTDIWRSCVNDYANLGCSLVKCMHAIGEKYTQIFLKPPYTPFRLLCEQLRLPRCTLDHFVRASRDQTAWYASETLDVPFKLMCECLRHPRHTLYHFVCVWGPNSLIYFRNPKCSLQASVRASEADQMHPWPLCVSIWGRKIPSYVCVAEKQKP